VFIGVSANGYRVTFFSGIFFYGEMGEAIKIKENPSPDR